MFWGTVLRAQSIHSANPACFRQQQQQQLQWYTVSMHPHKGTVGLRLIPPCVQASKLCTTDGARTSQQQQQQQQQLVCRRVISPPYNLRAPEPRTHPCSRTSTSCDALCREEPALICCRDYSCPPEGRGPNHSTVCRCHLSEHRTIYTHRKAALTFTC